MGAAVKVWDAMREAGENGKYVTIHGDVYFFSENFWYKLRDDGTAAPSDFPTRYISGWEIYEKPISGVEALKNVIEGSRVKKKLPTEDKFYGLSADGQRIFGWYEARGSGPVRLSEFLDGEWVLVDEP